jgi:hypothetical protein
MSCLPECIVDPTETNPGRGLYMEHSAFQMVSPSRDTDPATGELASHGTTAHFAVEAAGISCQVPSNANAGRRVELNDVKTGSYNDLTA